ncbi:MAG: type V CRISPR-associated protein Cas12k [Cyanobacteria bacterium J06621_15]
MSVKTIQCRLVADDNTLRHLWELMAEKNTPLANEILQKLAKHDDFETWVESGRMPKTVIKELCDSLKNQEPFAGQPGRFYTSAISLVTYIYKSWLALNKRLQRKIEGKEKWLEMLKSDAELEQESSSSSETIRTKATEILASLAAQKTDNTNQKSKSLKKKKSKQEKIVKSPSIKSSVLFDAYRQTEDSLTKCAVVHLLKNNCQVNDIEEDEEKYTQQRRKKEIEIKRLKEQLKNRVPKGRDLTGEKWLEALEQAVNSFPENENEAKSWQASLLRKTKIVPFPVAYETNEDVKWSINDEGRMFVSFNGLGKLKFEVYCDKRHLHLFRCFIEDQEIKHQGRNQHSSSLFLLRSARISWSEKPGKGKPWNLHRLHLFCSIDTRMLTAEGTQQVIEEKVADVKSKLAKAKQKEIELGELNSKQQADIIRKQSTLARINTPFPRPSKPLYQGKSHILVGVSLGLEKPATIAVFDAANDKVLIYLTTKQLLGDNYNLLNRQRQQKQRLAHQRHKAQKQFAPNNFGESELGQYVDRLLSKEIVAIAKTYSAGSIVVPKLSDMREVIQSEVQAKAEKKIPGFIEGQKNYAKEYRKSIHNWSYGRLIENIQSQAAKAGIMVETGQQPTRGSPQEQAKDLALFAYQYRLA